MNKNLIYLACDKDHLGGYLIGSPEYLLIQIHKYFGDTVTPKEKVEDHTGMIQGYDGRWRWL